jgi:hypothetical protein
MATQSRPEQPNAGFLAAAAAAAALLVSLFPCIRCCHCSPVCLPINVGNLEVMLVMFFASEPDLAATTALLLVQGYTLLVLLHMHARAAAPATAMALQNYVLLAAYKPAYSPTHYTRYLG